MYFAKESNAAILYLQHSVNRNWKSTLTDTETWRHYNLSQNRNDLIETRLKKEMMMLGYEEPIFEYPEINSKTEILRRAYDDVNWHIIGHSPYFIEEFRRAGLTELQRPLSEGLRSSIYLDDYHRQRLIPLAPIPNLRRDIF